MLITFRSRYSGDVLMMAPHALKVLQAAGRNYGDMPAQGVFTVEQLPEAIAHLEAAIAHETEETEAVSVHHHVEGQASGAPAHHVPLSEEEEAAEEVPEEHGVQLRQRAYPLLQMMKAALENKGSVVWGDNEHYM